MSTMMLDISEVHSPTCSHANSEVSSLRTANIPTNRALSKMSCYSEVPSLKAFYSLSNSIFCSEVLSLKTFYSLFTSLDINKSNNTLPDLFKPASKGHTYKDPRLSSLMPHTKVDLYKSPSQLVLPLTNSLALPKLRTITMMSLPSVDPASKWHKMESIIMMPPLLSAAATLYAIYKTVPASKWPEICLAKPRPNYKTAPAYKESRASCQWYKVTQASKWYEVQTLSKVDVIKFSSSLCLMDPRLQYLMYMKSHPREGITRHSATSGQLPASRP